MPDVKRIGNQPHEHQRRVGQKTIRLIQGLGSRPDQKHRRMWAEATHQPGNSDSGFDGGKARLASSASPSP